MTTPKGYAVRPIATVATVAEAQAIVRLLPWTLVELSPEPVMVAVRLTWRMRLVTWWLNIGRRREARRRKAENEASWAERERRRAAGLPLEDGTARSPCRNPNCQRAKDGIFHAEHVVRLANGAKSWHSGS